MCEEDLHKDRHRQTDRRTHAPTHPHTPHLCKSAFCPSGLSRQFWLTRTCHPPGTLVDRLVILCLRPHRQCVAVCCSALQCVPVCCSALYSCACACASVCCSVLQCSTVCCSVLQCVAMCFSAMHSCPRGLLVSVVQYIAVHRISVVQYIAVRRSVLQCGVQGGKDP